MDTFSESWYRVANQRIRLNPSIRCRKQLYRSRPYYVLYDPVTRSCFRLPPPLYRFIARLSPDRTVEEAWIETLAEDPHNGPGQQEVLNLLIELNNENLLFFEMPIESSHLYERAKKKGRQELIQQASSLFLFFRLPVWNPDRWLTRMEALWRLIFNKFSLMVWAVVVFWGIRVGVENIHALSAGVNRLLIPGNIALMYVGIVILKTLHEMGHAGICKRLGGEVGCIGLMFLVFVPLPYVDTTASWEFDSKWHRIMVSAGGMVVEFFVGAICCILWASAPPGVFKNLLYNMLFAATVSTILFNGNPLMRFDGYYIFSDLIEIPNLYQKSREILRQFIERYLFGVKETLLLEGTPSQYAWLFGYGIASLIYRIIVFGAILLFVAQRYHAAGMALAVSVGAIWILKPIYDGGRYLMRNPRLDRRRIRAWAVVLIVVGAALYLLTSVKFPQRIVAPGVIESASVHDVISEVEGMVKYYAISPGREVKKGDTLLVLSNPLLHKELTRLNARLMAIQALKQKDIARGARDIGPIVKRERAILKLIDDTKRDIENLKVRAKADGVWIFEDWHETGGQWVKRGHLFGRIVDMRDIYFTGVVSQEQAERLFASKLVKAKVRLSGSPDITLLTGKVSTLPHAQRRLPSKALGWQGGGDVPVAMNDPTGLRSKEPFYIVKAELITPYARRGVFEGETGNIMLSFPPQTLLQQGLRYVRQFFQKRYLL